MSDETLCILFRFSMDVAAVVFVLSLGLAVRNFLKYVVAFPEDEK